MIWRTHNVVLLGGLIIGLFISFSLSDPTAAIWAIGIILVIKIVTWF